MSIKSDFHLHSSFSADSDTPMEDMIQKAIDLGLDSICFTEHHDEDFVSGSKTDPDAFLLNTDSYLYDLIRCKDLYRNRIKILFGVELGVQPHLTKHLTQFTKQYDFDFVIASTHACYGQDPYCPPFYEGRTEEEAYRQYFSCVLENVTAFTDFDVCGHMDYTVRYGPNTNQNYSYKQYADIFDNILTSLIEKGKGIEVNTGGFHYGLGEPNPCTDIIRRYKELGGEIVTVGSDSHTPKTLCFDFDKTKDILLSCGFRYYTVFEKRMPEFMKLTP